MNQLRFVLLVFCAVGVAASASCRPSPPVASSSAAIPASGEFPRTLVLGNNRQVVIARKPVRIVSMSLGTDELLCALVGPERIAALSRYAPEPEVSNVPEIARRVGVFVEREPERIVALKPDLVLMARYTKAELRRVAELAGASTIDMTDLKGFADIEKNLRLIAKAVGEESRAESVIREMRERLSVARGKLNPKYVDMRVIFLMPGNFVAGRDTIHDECFSAAGLRNATAEAGISGTVKISEEQLLRLNPDLIVVAYGFAQDAGFREALLADPRFAPINAIRNRRVITLPSRALRTVSHHAAEGVEHLVIAVNSLDEKRSSE
jgi:iron complex transport system substrate-binding protein